MGGPRGAAIERFWRHVDTSGDCWLWLGAVHDGYEYGTFNAGAKRIVRTHRWIYEQLVGLIPAGLFVLHSCDQPRCVRPRHLFLGTQLDNIRDMDAKGRRRNTTRARAARVYRLGATCRQGHSRWRILTGGGRVCMECRRIREQERRDDEAHRRAA